MIVANLATYPPRAKTLPGVVARILPQVDRLNIVFNQHDAVPEAYLGNPKINAMIPHEDTKDVGKFYPDTSDAEFVLYIDDDVDYPEDFVAHTVAATKALPETRVLGGYHTSLYKVPSPGLTPKTLRAFLVYYLHPHKIARYRDVKGLEVPIERPSVVDQVATNAAIIRGADAPPYDYMRGSQKFCDVRLAKWCFEQGIMPVCLPRRANWLATELEDESIFRTFTSAHHPHVAEEIRSYAFRVPRRGEVLGVPA